MDGTRMVSFIYRRNNASEQIKKESQHMATKAKNSNFTAVIRDENYVEALTDFQWNNRLTRPELVRRALDEFAQRNGITVPSAEAAEADNVEAAEAPAVEAAEAPAATRRR